MKNLRHYVLLGIIILFGAILRYFNNNWDNGYMLHPDERFLTMVTTGMKVPETLAEYLNPAVSTFNPPNIEFGFWVYGIFPLIVNKFLTIWNNVDMYPTSGIFGRSLTATFDVITMLVVYKIAVVLQKPLKLKDSFPLLATFFYGIAVTAIQLSHFYAVDPFLNTFLSVTLLFLLYAAVQKRLQFIPFAAVTFALACASKVSAIYMVPLFAALIYYAMISEEGTIKERFFNKKTILNTLIYGSLFTVIAYIVLRLANPYYFETPNFLDPTMNVKFLENIRQLESFNSYEGYFPPAIQWMNKTPVLYSLKNFAILGVGIPYFILICIGLFLAGKRYRYLPLLLVGSFAVMFFLYQSVSFVKALRYTFFLYPLFALFAGLAVADLLDKKDWKWYAGILGVCLIWPLMFMNIYIQENSRVTASYWIHQNLPNGSLILSELWDDGLPLAIPEGTKQFPGEQMGVFDPDSPEKFTKMKEQMSRADYYILSSNRAWGSIPTVPLKYPTMSSWYSELFEGKHGYKIIKEFTVYPSLQWMGIPLTLNDDWADETFNVYDHPKVIIMENSTK